MQEDRKAAYTPAARYYVKECSKDKLVLSREEVNMGGPNLIEGDVTFRRMGEDGAVYQVDSSVFALI